MSDLPDGWAWTDAATVTEVQGGIQKQPKRRPVLNRYPFLRVANVKRGRLDLSDVHEIELFDGEIDRFRLRAGDLLVVEGNGSPDQIGRAALWNDDIQECVHQNHLIRVRPTAAINPKYLAYYWNAPQVTQYLRSVASSTSGLYVLTASKVRSVRIPLAPMAEQLKIVAAIEEQFSRLDSGVEAFGRAELNMKRLRDLIPLHLLERENCKESDWRTLAEVSEQVVDCPHSTPAFVTKGFPCVDTTCISSGKIHRDRLRYVSLTTYEDRVRRLVPRGGDIIFAREGTVGTAVVVPPELNPCLGQRVMLFRPNLDKARSDYLCLMINSEVVKRQYRSKLLGSTVPHLNVRDAKDLRIPLPQLAVQKDIAARADEIMSGHSFTGKIIESNQRRSFALRSSILAAAFSGDLA